MMLTNKKAQRNSQSRKADFVESLESRQLLSFTAHINMEPASVPVPAGYVADVGLPFGNRGNGYAYGWDSNVSVDSRIRYMASDLRYDTLIHTQKNGGNHSWEISLPNGIYTVHMVSGDAGYIDSIYRFNANGTLLLSGTPTNANHWISGTATVTVTNGLLMITNAAGSQNNKIDFIDITQVPTPTPTPVPTSTPFHVTPLKVGQPIQAEDYDVGGEGVAYHDTTSADLGSGYRHDAVDVQPGVTRKPIW